ncbi:MAG: SDR family NAD(P)-dependent oxidoreductase [Candidatus Omnitrophica bacterium]|nr:SDR family NAD(P)-dependent oxidoreductase [Candidatus Omnitrophota bacterium]
MNIKEKKFLITGATGFVGANLTRHFLKKGARVSILKRRNSNSWRIKDIIDQVSFYDVDLLDSEKLNKTVKHIRPDVVVHTAVYGGYIAQYDPELVLKTNFYGTVNLLNSCLKKGFEFFINTGSSSEYGIKNSPMREADLLEPVTPYGVSKAAASIYCQYVAKKYRLPIATLRLFSPYGYFDDISRVISYIALSCLRNKKFIISSPEAVRDFVFIDDVVDSYEKLLINGENLSFGIFNIGSGVQYSVRELTERIIKIMGCSALVKYEERPSARVEPKKWVANISKSKKDLKWKPWISIEEGLRKTIEWFEEHKGLYF